MKKHQFTKAEIEAARVAKNAALREWRHRNPDKVKAAQIRHFLKKAMTVNNSES